MAEYVQYIQWNGEELEIHFSFNKGYEGKIYGAPEDCYPGEPDEWELLKVIYEGVDVRPLLDDDDVLDKLKEVDDDY